MLALCLAALLYLLLARLPALMNAVRPGAGTGEADPMFAEPAEYVTRPPESMAEETQRPHKTLDDYVPDVLTPVERTAEELIAEAQDNAC